MKLAITLLKQKGHNIKYNLTNAAITCRNAMEHDAETVLLPEYFNIGFNTETESPIVKTSINFLNRSYSKPYYPFIKYLVRTYATCTNIVATDLKKYLKPITEEIETFSGRYIVGSVPLKEGKKIYNTGFIIKSNGEIFFRQKKMHPYDYQLHMIDPHDPLDMTVLKGFNTAIAICWDSLEGEMETAINMGAQLILSPTLFTIYASALKYSHYRAEELKNYIYFACSTIIPQNKANRITGGGFIVGPDIDKTKHTEGFMIQKLNKKLLLLQVIGKFIQ